MWVIRFPVSLSLSNVNLFLSHGYLEEVEDEGKRACVCPPWLKIGKDWRHENLQNWQNLQWSQISLSENTDASRRGADTRNCINVCWCQHNYFLVRERRLMAGKNRPKWEWGENEIKVDNWTWQQKREKHSQNCRQERMNWENWTRENPIKGVIIVFLSGNSLSLSHQIISYVHLSFRKQMSEDLCNHWHIETYDVYGDLSPLYERFNSTASTRITFERVSVYPVYPVYPDYPDYPVSTSIFPSWPGGGWLNGERQIAGEEKREGRNYVSTHKMYRRPREMKLIIISWLVRENIV